MREMPGAALFAVLVLCTAVLAACVRNSTDSAADALLRDRVGQPALASLAARSLRVFTEIPGCQ
jgi:hypothetical protein